MVLFCAWVGCRHPAVLQSPQVGSANPVESLTVESYGTPPCPEQPPAFAPSAPAAASGSVSTSGTRSVPPGGRQKGDSEAEKLDRSAMEQSLHATLEHAESNLKQALQVCDKLGCSPRVRARVLVHLGIVWVSQGKESEAATAFEKALGIDRFIRPEADYNSNATAEAFAVAQAKTGTQGMVVMTVAEQVVNTPVPIFAELHPDIHVAKVTAFYRWPGDERKKVALKPKGRGWAGAVPPDLSEREGTLEYFVKAYDDGGDVVESVGSKNSPLKTMIRKEVECRPHLPGEPPIPPIRIYAD